MQNIKMSERQAQAKYYMALIKSVYSSEFTDFRIAFFKLYAVLTEIIDSAVKSEKQIFSSEFAKIEFVINKYAVDDDTAHGLHSVRYFKSKLRKSRNITPKQNDLNFTAKVAIKLVGCIYGDAETAFSKKLSEAKIRPIPFEKPLKKEGRCDFLNSFITGKFEDKDEFGNSRAAFMVKSDEGNEFSLYITEEWEEFFRNAECDNVEVNLLSVYPEKDYFVMQFDSLIVLEPDVMVDVTELAGCFVGMGTDYRLYFFNMFLEKKSTPKILVGNIVNYMFDEIVLNGISDYNELYERAIRENSLSLFANSFKEPNELRREFAKLPEHFKHILDFVAGNVDRKDDITLEASFISARYGIQGRLDYFAESTDNPLLKNIIELKSGKASNINSAVYIDNTAVKIGLWYGQYAQVIAYNMLLDSAFDGRIGNSAVFYSGTNDFPVRNVVNSDFPKFQIVHLRNQIVNELLKISAGDAGIIDLIFSREYSLSRSIPVYNKEYAASISAKYNFADDWKKDYIRKYFMFLIREWLSQYIRISCNGRNNPLCSDLWKQSEEERSERYSYLAELELVEEKSDLNKLHLWFNIHRTYITTIRQNEIMILYNPAICGDNAISNQLITVTVKDVDSEHIVVSLRNKEFPVGKLLKSKTGWILDIAGGDMLIKRLVSSLASFLLLDDRRAELLKGLISPEFDNKREIKLDDAMNLNANQNEILTKAIRAKDYFLIQGPPGTGKTSYMVRNIVKYFIENEDGDILISAYTNRAVDEICSVIRSLGYNDISFRLGRRESSIYPDMLFCNIVENNDIRKTFREMSGRRIVIGTVYSLISQSDIFAFKNFKLAVIDEASQIMEPQIIGILCKVRKFIMIGDEKQLPAIINQDVERFGQICGQKDVCPIEPEISLFEKLLKVCKKNRLSQSYGILNCQARMHEDIQAFPNKYFYENELKTLQAWQSEPMTLLDNTDMNEFFRKLTSSRLVFIDTPTESVQNANYSEVYLTMAIINKYIKLLGDKFDSNSIGVICPFRAQGNEIIKRLPDCYRRQIMVDTVERFQGSERDIIIYSTAVNTPNQVPLIKSEVSIGDKIIDRKLNVVITRARQQFILIGNYNVLSDDFIYGNLIKFIANAGSVIDCSKSKFAKEYAD